jgi:CheY-like chemotaxis protein
MKKLFVVDTDEDFQTQVKSQCPPDQVEVRLFSSGMDIFSLVGKEKPYMIFVSLEVPDVNDFVIYDLLKKTEDNSIHVVVTYSNHSEKDLQQYKKMKYQPKEYCKKPISNENIYRLLQKHLELDEEDDEEFSDENIDRLVKGEYLKIDVKDKDDTKELLEDTNKDFAGKESQSDESEVEIAKILKTDENKTSSADKELRNQVISLEQQNEFLRTENKKLSEAIEELKTNKDKSVPLVQEAEERLESEFRRKEEQLIHETRKLKEEQEKNELSLQNEINHLKQLINQLQNDSDELKKREESLNEAVSKLMEEKVSLSEKVKTLEENLSNQQQEMEEKENTHLLTLEKLNKELEKLLDRLQFYKFRVNELGGLLQQALALTQSENLE